MSGSLIAQRSSLLEPMSFNAAKSTDFYQIFAHLALFIHCTVLHLSIAVKLLGISQVLEIPRIETIWWSLKEI